MITLQKTLNQIEKRFGKGTIVKLGDKSVEKIKVVSTGITALDNALGVGGLPCGRVVEVFGPEAGGKTTLALQTVAQVQKLKKNAAYIDMEHCLDVDYAKALGVNTNELLVAQPDYGEQGLEIAEKLLHSDDMGIVVIDSVAALIPKAELEGEMGEFPLGLQARLMSQALRKLTALVHKSDAILFFINQIRHKIGIMFGNPETTSGGVALKFYSSMRIDIRRISAIKDKDDNVIGANTKIKIVKNKLAPPYKEVEAKLIYSKGFVNN